MSYIIRLSFSVLTLAVFLLSGGTVKGDDAQDTKDIVGTWKLDYSFGLETLKFTKDGKVTRNLQLVDYKYKWKISNGILVTVDDSGKAEKHEYTLIDDTLKLETSEKNSKGEYIWRDYTRKK